jgi:hypothetical protein
MANFPAIKPASRSYSPGNYPIRDYTTLNGAVWKRIFGNKRSGMTLSLEFRNIDDAAAAQILNHYDGQAGTYYGFGIPSVLYAGMDGSLQFAAAIPQDVKWVYASAPDVQSVFPGVSTVTVELVGQIEYR